jgi:hypothetical protein
MKDDTVPAPNKEDRSYINDSLVYLVDKVYIDIIIVDI